ncbi:MAG TPA: type II toxin-antitoxin system PemK/MazF family toxin [Bacteroidetes bacterium]|nr:type II toxin-antitoxin system PemK/MazF family toxin [Bacteroidota bacterium]
MEVNQYDVILVNLDPTVGAEIRKTRPCVVISPEELNHNLNTVVIAPMTTNLKNYPTRVNVKFGNKKGKIAVDQIRTIDSKRIVKIMGKITKKEIKILKEIIKQTYVD